jgi:hypothetical protein
MRVRYYVKTLFGNSLYEGFETARRVEGLLAVLSPAALAVSGQ